MDQLKILFSYKIKAEACEPGSAKQRNLMNVGVNYLLSLLLDTRLVADICSRYRYGTLIVLSNYLIERRLGETDEEEFAVWLRAHREITTLLSRRNMD